MRCHLPGERSPRFSPPQIHVSCHRSRAYMPRISAKSTSACVQDEIRRKITPQKSKAAERDGRHISNRQTARREGMSRLNDRVFLHFTSGVLGERGRNHNAGSDIKGYLSPESGTARFTFRISQDERSVQRTSSLGSAIWAPRAQ